MAGYRGGKRMPFYYFHVQDGRDQDFEGVELPDLEAARREAIRFAGYLIQQVAENFFVGELWSMQVCNKEGARYMTLEFSVLDEPGMAA
ncbi:MAG TPA: hypothetical protein VMQ93_07450 [Novosphingobium sp.]|nr:hypothetical protein [Novosphingobium sp.]